MKCTKRAWPMFYHRGTEITKEDAAQGRNRTCTKLKSVEETGCPRESLFRGDRRLSQWLCVSVVLFGFLFGARAADWPQLARDAAHSGITPKAARTLGDVAWTAVPSADEQFVTDSSPVVAGGLVIVNARRYSGGTQVGNRLIAFDIYDGERIWATPIESDVWESWASPAIDLVHRTVLLGVGYHLYAFDLDDGGIAWQAALSHNIVNASPIVTTDLTTGGTPTNRAFITDSTFAGNAMLYAINLDPYQATHNPYQPGGIVWTAALPGASGNTPAYANGVVYTLSLEGLVRALDARGGGPIWQQQVDFDAYPQYTGFYGGLAIHGGYAYAASYSFYGTGNNSGLFKFDLTDGDVVWDIPCERTNSMPVITDDLRIFLAAGLTGYGSAIKVQAFQDQGGYATQLWDTYTATGGSLIVGGWSAQPAFSRGYLYAGEPTQSGGDAGQTYLKCYVLDTSKTPNESGFIVSQYSNAGGSAAITDGTVYTLGIGGLYAFDPTTACLADINNNGVVDINDLADMLGRYGSRRWDSRFNSAADLDRNGLIDLNDLALFLGVYGSTCD